MRKHKRLSKTLNFIAFNILFFALYLNFVHEGEAKSQVVIKHAEARQETVLVDNPKSYMEKGSYQKQVASAENSPFNQTY